LKEELLKKAKLGDGYALKELYLYYHPVVYSLKRKYDVNTYDEDDWLQVGFIVFHRCVLLFNDAFEVTLGKYFKVCFRNYIRSCLRKQQSFRRKSNIHTLSLDYYVNSMERTRLNPLISESDPLKQLLLKETIEESAYNLSDLEQEALYSCLIKEEKQEYPRDREDEKLKLQRARSRARSKLFLDFHTY